MKKKLLCLVLCMMLPLTFLLFGCNEEKPKVWLDSYKLINELLAEDTLSFSNIASSPDYNSKLNGVILNEEYASYYELNSIYHPLCKLPFVFIMHNKEALKVNPVKSPDDTMIKNFNKLNDTLKECKTSYINLKNERIEFIDSYQVTENFNNIIELNRLKNFKRELSSFIDKMISASEAFEKAYTYAYRQVSYTQSSSLSQNEEEFILKYGINNMLRPIYRYSINELNSEDIYNKNPFDVKSLVDYILSNKTISNDRINNILKFQTFYISYKEEVKMFNSSLDNVDLKELYLDLNGNKVEYFKKNIVNKAYVDKIEDFNTRTLPIFFNVLKGLFI